MSFHATLCAAGLRPRDIVADGQWRRCATDDKPRKRNGAYVLHPDGRGFWRNWALDAELNSWTDEGATRAAPVDAEVAQRRREAERAARIRAMQGARAYWDRARALNRPHPYIEGKGLSPLGCAGLRSIDGLLLVPVWHGNWIISTQSISPDGVKRFFAGAPVKAGAFVIDRPRAAMTCVCEGLATGLAIFQSVRQARVIVAFDAGNLLPVLQRLKPQGNVILCADNDHGTMLRRGVNPGVEKATNAAELIGAGVVWPQGIEGTDFADALKEWGQGGAKRVERLIQSGSRYVTGAIP